MEMSMRSSRFLPRFGESADWRHSHFALAYDAWAPVDESGEYAGKVPPELGNERQFRAKWLAALEGMPIDACYEHAYERWKTSLRDGGAQLQEIELASRLLIGHGNASATEVGLTVQHTWGVPMIPGSALKGLCAHYTAATYGLRRQEMGNPAPSSEPRGDERFSGPKWEKGRRRIEAPPGDYYRALFGAPEVDNDASAGLVVFHDALYVPGTPAGPNANKPFAVDVLTVHQRAYYGQLEGQTQPGERWPNDYDSPNPVGFISVRPGARFLLALSGEGGWPALAHDLLTEAIGAWGGGGKTSAGYGRIRT
jgi:CRISPR-associated protein Cmr6